MTKLKAGIGAVVAAGVAAPLVMQYHAQVKLSTENQSLRQKVEGLTSENDRLSDLLIQASRPGPLPKEQLSEPMKLRGEIGLLRKKTNELGKVREENRRSQTSPAESGQNSQSSEDDSAAEQQRLTVRAKTTDLAKIMLDRVTSDNPATASGANRAGSRRRVCRCALRCRTRICNRNP